MCPGRHFASVEVMCFIGMILIPYNVTAVDGEGKFPELNYGNLAASIMPPLENIKAKVASREDYMDYT